MLSVQILARVGRNIGLGHWARATCLHRELVRRNHRAAIRPIFEANDAPLELPLKSNFVENISDPNICIVDDPMDPDRFLMDGKFNIAFDYFKSETGKFDAVVNCLDDTLSSPSQTPKPSRLSGLDFVIVDPDFLDFPAPPRELRILVSVGGLDIHSLTKLILRNLKSWSRFSEVQYTEIVLSEDHADYKLVREMSREVPNVNLHGLLPSLKPSMVGSSLLICNGGNTAVQAILGGRPTLYLAQTKAERDFLTALQVPQNLILDPIEVFNSELFLSALEIANSRTKKPQSFVDGLGAQRVVDFLERRFSK